MSGHSKWSKVKHQKATTDVVKVMAFTRAARAITIAVHEGGGVGDPNHNFHLRLAIEKARDVNMPKENIERAIEKGMGVGANTIEQVLYEGYGPGGVGILIETATDNKVRTVGVIKNLFDRAGGAVASPGAVSYQFERCGILTVPKSASTFDVLFEAALDAGASDVVDTVDMFEVYTTLPQLALVKQSLLDKKIQIDNTEVIMKPKMHIPFDGSKRNALDQLLEGLEGLDDVQHVFTNIE